MRQLRRQPHDGIHMVMGFMADKDITTMIKMLPAEAKLYFTQANTKRALTAKKLLEEARKSGYDGTTYTHVSDALKAARKNANEKDVIYVGGSMYVLAELVADLGYDR